MKNRALLSSSLTIALLLSACGGNNGDDGPGDESIQGGDFNIAWSAQPPTLDPLMTTANSSRDIARNFLEPLLTLDNDGEAQPVLAESYEVSDDGTELTIVLRDDVVFHNGSPMTADDVIASLQRWMEVTNVGQTYFSEAEVGSENMTVTLSFPEPMWAAPLLLADQSSLAFIMPAEIVEEATEGGVQEFIGTGPFEFVEWVSDDHIRLDRFEDYQPPSTTTDGDAGPREPHLDSIYFHFVSDPSTRLTGIQTGEYDAADSMPHDNAEMMETDENIEVTVGEYGLNFAFFNKAEGLMSDINMRRAVMAAIDPEENLLAAYGASEYYDLQAGLAPEGTAWSVPYGEGDGIGYDQDLVDEYLEEAGYDGEQIEILTTREYEHVYNTAVMLQEQLERAGMNTELTVMDWAAMLQHREDPGNWDLSNTVDQWRAVPATWNFLLPTQAGWTDSEEIATALDSLVFAASEEDAHAAMEELQTAVDEYIPVAIFGTQWPLFAIRDGFDGYEYTYFAGHKFYNVHQAD